MATLALDLNHRLQASHGAAPVWWRQRHTYVLAAVTALQVIGCRWVMQAVDGAGWAGVIAVGVLIGQCFLLGLWGALGGLATLPRWGIIGLVHLSGLASVSLSMSDYGDGLWTEALEMGIVGALLVLAFAACLLPLRGLAGWRVDFDERVYRDVRGRRGQVGFMDFAGYSLGVAAALAAARLSIQAEVFDTDALWIVLGMLLAVVLVAAPSAYALVVWRRLWLALALAAAWALAVAAGNSWLADRFENLDFLGSPSPAWGGVRLPQAAFYFGIVLALAFSLVPLRLFGLRLIAVPLPDLSSRMRQNSDAGAATPNSGEFGYEEATRSRAA